MDHTMRQFSGLALRTMRIASGLFLLLFVTSHLLNLSLGLISIEAMDAARPYLSGFWSSPPLGPLLLSSLLVHFLAGLWAIYRRPTLRTNAQDLVQLFSGVLVIPLLAVHAIGVASLDFNGVQFGYAEAIHYFWSIAPQIGLLQVIMLSVVWIHGCAGLFTWLRAKESMRNVLAWMYPLAVAVPVIALLGYAEAGRGVLIQAQSPRVEQPQDTTPTETKTPSSPADVQMSIETIKQVTNQVIWWSLTLAVLTFAARALRLKLKTSEPVSIRLGGGPAIQTTSGLSMLDSFRLHDQPHASLCEGRGRCGTCAVRVLRSEFPLPDPNALEAKTLLRIGAGDNIRLACQLKPSGGTVALEPLYPPDFSFRDEDFAQESKNNTARVDSLDADNTGVQA